MKKKILSLITAFAMVFGIIAAPFATASADTTNTPGGKQPPTGVTSTIDETKLKEVKKEYDGTNQFSTTLHIHKLVAESYGDAFPFLHDGGKLDLKQLQTANGGKEIKALAGVEFTYYKVETAKLLDEMMANPSQYETKDQMDALVAKEGSGITQGATLKKTDAKGEASVTLTRGYYWFIESDRPSTVTGVKEKSVPFGIAIPVLNKDQDKWLEEVHTYPKNIEKNTNTDKHYEATTKDGKVDSKILNEWVKEYEKAKKAYDEAGETEKETKLKELETVKNKHGVNFANYLTAKTAVDARKGSTVPYEIQTELIEGQLYEKLTWTDAMTAGLTNNKDLKLYIKKPGANDFEEVPAEKYTKTERNNGFDLVVTDKDYILSLNKMLGSKASTKEENITKGNVTFKLVYSATVNGETIVDEIEKNHITFIPGDHKPGEPTSSDNGDIPVTKKWVKADDTEDNTKKQVKVVYILEDAQGNTVAEVTLDGTDAKVKAKEGVTFILDNNDKYSGTFKGLAKGQQYKVREFVDGYKGTYSVTGDAKGAPLTITNKPDKTVKTPEPPKVVTHDSKFVKVDGEKKTRLAGAKFVVTRKNDEKTQYLAKADDTELANRVKTYTDAENKYQGAIAAINQALAKGKISDSNKATVEGTAYNSEAEAWKKVTELQTARDKAYKEMKITWKWTETESEAFVFTSNKDGQIYVEGLADGEYFLKEKEAPEGYAKRNKDYKFIVGTGRTYDYKFNKVELVDTKAADTKELTQDSEITGMTLAEAKKLFDANKDGKLTVKELKDGADAFAVENKKITIPQTGGIGSLIFIVAGVAIMTFAFVAYKRSEAREA
ncbi:pilin N-terminal domain-containing protein [Anaerococcus tetradius]|uniref:pilin N-terminal domain-containing protein n=1 Tax=Anaerococcus tetradius TaxID=33036 RepID=UPI0023F1775E|nr:SpaA isopeptide-forming pilin-related protein [Anaerococcus tetradius]